MMQDVPATLLEAVRYFSDLTLCHHYMRKVKWPDGNAVCPNCEAKDDRIGEIATRQMLRCKDCRKQFSVKVDTIFEDSPLGLDKWFVAVWCIANAKNGISSHELGRALGVTQKTAWFMLHRIREALYRIMLRYKRISCVANLYKGIPMSQERTQAASRRVGLDSPLKWH